MGNRCRNIAPDTNYRNLLRTIPLLFLLALAHSGAATVVPTILKTEPVPEEFSVTNTAHWAEVPADDITFEQVLLTEESFFSEMPFEGSKSPNLGFTASAWWVWFDVVNESDEKQHYLLEMARPVTNEIELYYTSDGSSWTHKTNGDAMPFALREVKHRKLLFDVVLPAVSKTRFFARIKSDGEVVSLPIVFRKPEVQRGVDYTEQLALGVYYGVLLFAIVIFFFFYMALKERSFFYYVFYVLFLLLLQLSLDGLSFKYLWPESPWLASHGVVISAALGVLFLALYTKTFLRLRERMPKINLVFRTYAALSLLAFLLALTSGAVYAFAHVFVNLVAMTAIFVLVATLVILYRKGYRVDPFFHVAFGFLLLGTASFLLGNLNVVENNFWTEYGIKLGSGLEVVFLSLTMANRYREIQREKQAAQREALEKLEEMNRLKDRINIELEEKVALRTREIQAQSDLLAEKNSEIFAGIRYAERIQKAVLDDGRALSHPFPDSAIIFHPRDIVSGDFIRVRTTRDAGGPVMFAVADCTGHGVPGAMMSILNHNLINEATETARLTNAGEILNYLNLHLMENLRQYDSGESLRDGMDIAFCIYDTEKHLLNYAGAKLPLWIVRPAGRQAPSADCKPREYTDTHALYEMSGDKSAIGNDDHPDFSFTDHRIQLEKGDILWLMTDGAADQFGGNSPELRAKGGTKLKYKTLRDAVLERADAPMAEQTAAIDRLIHDWMDGYEQTDDICVMGIRVG